MYCCVYRMHRCVSYVQVGCGTQWAMSELPVDYTFWLEQGMDPTHANFLHHTCKSL